MLTVHVFISGLVQGVGFRAFVKARAQKLGITGWVRNTSDGKVEGLFVGSKTVLEKLIAQCNKGPMLSEVRDVWVEWEGPPSGGDEQFNSFEIVQ